jgi:hypothetical protein
MLLHRFAWGAPIVVAVIAAACAGGSENTGGPGQFGGGDSTAASGGGGSSSPSSGGGGAGGRFDPTGTGGSGASSGEVLIYAHTDTTLFQLDPNSPDLSLTTLGDFDCIDPDSNGEEGIDYSMNDIAVDANQNVWGVSARYVYPLTIEDGAVHCGTPIAFDNPDDTRFYALTFAPKGVLDPNKEVLIAGNAAGELWAIDESGNISIRGHFGPVPANDGQGHNYPAANVGQNWELSGDIVFLENEGSPVGYATVRDCPNPPSTGGCNPINTLIEIDLSKIVTSGLQVVTKSVRGQIVKHAGCTDSLNNDYGNMYGIAAWNSKVYGFSRLGNIVDIALADGSACLVQSYPTNKFAGAGVTTIAPVIIPPA